MRAALLAVVAVAAAAVALGTAAPAGATNECRGLMICVPIAGPWVVVPAGTAVPRTPVQYQLDCPRRYIAGGLDAELSEPAIDLAFLGVVGSPVSPGVTTTRSVVFVGTFVGDSPQAPTFRPHVGCVPAAGGGQRVPTSAKVVFPPGQPTVRHVRNVRLVPGRVQHVVQGCGAGERLVGASHAVGIYTAAPPPARLVGGVSASGSVRGGKAEVTVRTGAALRGVRAVVQLSAICAGGQ